MCLCVRTHACFYYTRVCVVYGAEGFDSLQGFPGSSGRESSLRVLKFILLLSAPVKLTNPSAARVQTLPQDSPSAHQSYLGLYVHVVGSGRLLLKALASRIRGSVTTRQIGESKVIILRISSGCLFLF